ncbi:hypothetical protein Ade02nite_39650 [Paractinoplanes deccanensis]|uniref:Molecular chaperone DnaJ n=1 Tax=Paractinoplanes deccanensis TaxID=113561 RepID=A0ABQ3Y5Q2_9ACTN|nr:hypothetical protein [Actinoplanes deccanensis]GID75324.1 hypothetical protein Ade02nite_39650 [Actinoplanes deccanensis]
MKWLLLLLVLLIAAAVVARLLLKRAGEATGPATRRRCVRCHGTGWVGGGPQRTLDFDGSGFEDRHAPATMCDACGGTGLSTDR